MVFGHNIELSYEIKLVDVRRHVGSSSEKIGCMTFTQ